MKCPISILSPKTKYGYDGECFNKNCALWDEVANGCLIRTYLISQIEKSDVIIKPIPTLVEEKRTDKFNEYGSTC